MFMVTDKKQQEKKAFIEPTLNLFTGSPGGPGFPGFP